MLVFGGSGDSIGGGVRFEEGGGTEGLRDEGAEGGE